MATTNELFIKLTFDDMKATADFKKVADKILSQANQSEKKLTDIKNKIGRAHV